MPLKRPSMLRKLIKNKMIRLDNRSRIQQAYKALFVCLAYVPNLVGSMIRWANLQKSIIHVPQIATLRSEFLKTNNILVLDVMYRSRYSAWWPQPLDSLPDSNSSSGGRSKLSKIALVGAANVGTVIAKLRRVSNIELIVRWYTDDECGYSQARCLEEVKVYLPI